MHRVVLLLLGLAMVLPGPAAAYDWPVKPFGVQHPVRGSFDDPRRGTFRDGQPEESFHSGIDISVPDGTAVYAVAAGWATLRMSAVVVTTGSGHVYGYWHIRPAVRNGQAVSQHQLLGRVERTWGHVHLSESIGAIYLNPLRRGGIAPYGDRTKPVIDDVTLVQQDGSVANIVGVSGFVDLLADTYDTPPLAPPSPWTESRVTPALVRWRILGIDGVAVRWRTAIDFRNNLLPSVLFNDVYAPGTTANRPNHPGDYRFYLARGLDTHGLSNGVYVLQVLAADTRDNTALRSLPFRVANQSS